MIDIIRNLWRKPEPTAAPEPTPAERLEAIVRAKALSHEVIDYRIRRAAGQLGYQRRRERAGA